MKNRIENERWWDRALSLVGGCAPCSPGCTHCWSAAMTRRFDLAESGIDFVQERHLLTDGGKFNGHIVTHPERLSIPLKTRKPTVWAIWNDLFHEAVPFEFILAALTHAVGRCDLHKYLILTKRPQRMVDFFRWMDSDKAPHRVEIRDCFWFGLTVCNQEEANAKIPIFLQVPGKKFLSIEPMLSEINFGVNLRQLYPLDDPNPKPTDNISAVILGGETGPGARPLHPDWVRSVRDQCADAGVPFYFKQWGEYGYSKVEDDPLFSGGRSYKTPTGGRVAAVIKLKSRPYQPCPWRNMVPGDETVGGTVMLDHDTVAIRVGRKVAGRLLDGRMHDDLPWVTR